MNTQIETQRPAALEIAHRRHTLAVNRGLYARQQGPILIQLLANAGALRARCSVEIAQLERETGWGSRDAERLAELAGNVARFGCIRPEIADPCSWHAARMNELVRQYAALARLEGAPRPRLAWPDSRNRAAVAGKSRAPRKARRHVRA